ncbi:hypothetical protein HEB94_000184 [Actinopolymorpha pittospori]|uniref:Uncharacterized protein n=1 Tax=Actinopolymorpha pittospori TaxID=648752 RepID=A0A927MMD7_9ACTN|nr:hypothetical protein [Actinopolymorpha pittospori]MBE1603336.1 hypothetical protein [Actinopolymorpha pittospori]
MSDDLTDEGEPETVTTSRAFGCRRSTRRETFEKPRRDFWVDASAIVSDFYDSVSVAQAHRECHGLMGVPDGVVSKRGHCAAERDGVASDVGRFRVEHAEVDRGCACGRHGGRHDATNQKAHVDVFAAGAAARISGQQQILEYRRQIVTVGDQAVDIGEYGLAVRSSLDMAS